MTPLRLMEALDATWPAAETRRLGGWLLRRGQGAGHRVSAASWLPGAGERPDIAAAAAGMADWGQPALFRLGAEEAALDAALAEAGYAPREPVAVYAAPVAALADGADETARVIRVTTRLQVAEEIWAAGGVGPARRAVMARAAGPAVVLLARLGDRPAGVAFAALDRELAMVHAIEVAVGHRRRGAGAMLLRGAANWAAEHGAAALALAVTEANRPACALYDRLGMAVAARYHYRALPGPAAWG